jgi:hypothetical protein
MKNRMGAWMVILAAGIWAAPCAQASSYKSTPDAETKYQRPEDLLDMIPFLGQLPKSFLIGDGFKMRLTTKELRIDHMGTRSQTPAHKRNCMIGFSYSTPVAGFFTSRIDIPLMAADKPAVEYWTRSSLGDYVIFLSRTPVERAQLRLVATARF